MSPDQDALIEDVLADLAREPMGLYEVWYAANTLFPSAPMSERLGVSEGAIRRIVAQHPVRLWRTAAGGFIGSEPREPVDVGDLEGILLRFSTWAPEEGDEVVWMELANAV